MHRERLVAHAAGYAPATRAQLEAGLEVRATDYLLALAWRDRLRQAVEAAFATVDVLASPAVPFVAPHEDPRIGEGEDGELLASGFANLTGQPALSLPCGLSDGLPVGLQLVGRGGDDAGLLAIGAAVEAAIGFAARPPIEA